MSKKIVIGICIILLVFFATKVSIEIPAEDDRLSNFLKQNIESSIDKSGTKIIKPITLKQNKVEKVDGAYEVEALTDSGPVKKIYIRGIENPDDFSKIRLAEIEDEKNTDFAQVYAIDPTQVNFTEATVTVIAKGDSLYKCKEWNYETQTCEGSWNLFKTNLIPGKEYTFILTSDDPGFAEGITTCVAEDQAAKGTWPNSCLGSYSSACGAGGDLLRCDDGYMETHNYYVLGSQLEYAGVHIQEYNVSVTNCESIDSVQFCYEQWYSGQAPTDCDISVDADGGISFTAVTTTCPDTTTNPGITCTDVTSLETWNCANFFGPTGTRARAKTEMASSKNKKTGTLSTDVFYFNVTYTETDTTPPASITSLQNISTGQDWIYWAWTNPADGDFSENIIFIDNVNIVNTSNNYYNATGLTVETSYTIKVHTKDTNNNVNNADIENTASTTPKPDVDVNETIEDADGTPLTTTFEITDETNSTLIYNQTTTDHSFSLLKSSIYTIIIKPQNHIIQQIELKNITVTEDITNIVDIEEGNASQSFLFSVNPLLSNVNMTVTANGTELAEDGFRILEKCVDWNFTLSTCSGSWTPYAALMDNGLYNFTMDSLDPGFAEGISTCIAENEDSKNTWPSACDGSYSSACGAGGDLLRCNDGFSETQTYYKLGSAKYGGVQIQEYNTSITDCTSVTKVELCYERWYSGGVPTDCDISIDANGGISWTAITTTCPGNIADPGITCTDVTSLETWTCTNFFGPTGTRARAKTEMASNINKDLGTLTTDVFYFDVTYDSATPNITIIFPQDGRTYNYYDMFIRANITGENISTCWYNFNGNGNNTFTCGTEPNITAVEGTNNLTVYANNTYGIEASESIIFDVNTSVTLTISITDPANGTTKTTATPKLKLLAVDSTYSTINYIVYIYYENDTLYSIGNTGTLTNNTETEITLSPALDLIGNFTTYKIVVNATDNGNSTAESNILYYTLTKPAIELVSPAVDYWDNDGAITFSFRVEDESVATINCSLYIDTILNQTNETTLTDQTLTTFNVAGISDGTSKIWKIECTDILNNTGEDSRIFNVDKTAPVINWINDTPDPVVQGNIINFTTNVTDNINVYDVDINISGTTYQMNYASEDIYYYEMNTSGLSGIYNYTILAYDEVNNPATPIDGNFTVQDNSAPDSITNLQNISSGTTWIYWTWTNPSNPDFSETIIYINGTNAANTSNNYYNATGLISNTTYTITVHTKDTNSNVNNTDVNSTASTLEEIVEESAGIIMEWIDPDVNVISTGDNDIIDVNNEDSQISFVDNFWDGILSIFG